MPSRGQRPYLYILAAALCTVPAPTVATVGAPLWVVLGTAVWCLLFGLTLLAEETDLDRDRILRLLRAPDYLGLYGALTAFLLNGIARSIAPRSAMQKGERKPFGGFWAKTIWYSTPRAIDDDDLNRLSANPWSWPVLGVAMKLAVIYPLLLLLLQWGVTGDDTGIGNTTILLEERRRWVRLTAFCVIAMMVVAVILLSVDLKGVSKEQSNRLTLAAFLCSLAIAGAAVEAIPGPLAFAVSVGVVGALAGAGQGPFAIAVASAIAVTGSVAGSSGLAFILAVTFAFALAGAAGYGCQKRRGLLAHAALLVVLFVFQVGVYAAVSPRLAANDKSLLFAIGMLPLVNAVFDYLSYAVTISLIKLGAARKNILSFFLMLVDAAFAYALLIALGVALLATMALINLFAATPFIEPAAVLDGLRDAATQGDYLWLVATLFSTLVPTAVHVVVGLFSLLTWVPLWAKTWIVDQLVDEKTGVSGTLAACAAAATLGAFWLTGIGWAIYGLGKLFLAEFPGIGFSILLQVEWVVGRLGLL